MTPDLFFDYGCTVILLIAILYSVLAFLGVFDDD
jgi:hypothetical protein